MQPSEAALILAKIASFDRRTVGEADARAWAEVLDGKVTLQDAMTAVTEHFASSVDWLMPAHVIKLASKIRRDRINAAGYPDMPNGLTQQQEREWLHVWHESIGEGRPPSWAEATADRILGLDRRIPTHPADPLRVLALMASSGFGKALPYRESKFEES